MRHLFFLAGFLLLTLLCGAQDTLPRFAVKNLGNDRDGRPSVVISWVNPFDSLLQISIQTSHDSLRNYRTLISLTDPNAKMNGYADRKAPNDHMYYRLFVVKPNGQYFFTNVSRPYLDTAKAVAPLETVVVKKPGESTANSTQNQSSAATSGTPNAVTTTVTPPVVKKPEFVPSFYVYTNKEGYVYVNLPDAGKKRYRLKFFEEDNSLLFEVKNIRQSGLTLDKTNFLHAGWFHFELYEDDELVERHRFYIGKEF